jgi:hypothetical protein
VRILNGTLGGYLSVNPRQSPMPVVSVLPSQTGQVFQPRQQARNCRKGRILKIFQGGLQGHCESCSDSGKLKDWC